jgi:4a-hydroxytetrahydrobiopterin dehydratase
MTTKLDPATLAKERCVAADDSTPVLAPDEVARLAAGLDPAWQVLDDRLVREFAFPTFAAAFGLATRIALLAEGQNHHPALNVAWGRLTVTWTTDAIRGLSANDLVMAAKVDGLVARGLALKGGRRQGGPPQQ